jgi:hypothetical protein
VTTMMTTTTSVAALPPPPPRKQPSSKANCPVSHDQALPKMPSDAITRNFVVHLCYFMVPLVTRVVVALTRRGGEDPSPPDPSTARAGMQGEGRRRRPQEEEKEKGEKGQGASTRCQRSPDPIRCDLVTKGSLGVHRGYGDNVYSLSKSSLLDLSRRIWGCFQGWSEQWTSF